MVPHPTSLEGELVRLEPLEPRHVPALMAISTATPEVFRYTSTPVDDRQAEAYFAKAFRLRDEGTGYPFAVLDRASGEVVGTSRFADYDPQHLRCELGYTWYPPRLFGTGVNVEGKYLMLSLAFERLGLHRVQIHTDARNEASQRAIRGLGARFEGVMRRHMVAKDGFVRDTVVFALTDLDWPEARGQIEARLRKRGVAPRPLPEAMRAG